jgi:glycosyltransferase involved in cell wall biosynthesis
MIDLPKISIITVNLNNGDFLEEAILSVITQNYPNIEYIMVDGDSTDNSLQVIEKYKAHFHKIIIEPDQGQYHAIQKGFNHSTGEIMAWINSDDKYLPGAFSTVVEIMATFKNINWLTGYSKEYSLTGSIIGRIHLPWCRWSKYRFYTNDFQFIQQESTFWKRELWEAAGSKLNLNYELAADMELWARFFRSSELHTTIAELSGFRHRSENQRSKAYRSIYLKEGLHIIKKERSLLSLNQRLHIKILSLARWVFGPFFFFQIPFLETIYPILFKIPQLIYYDFEKQLFSITKNTVRYPSFVIGNRLITKKTFFK